MVIKLKWLTEIQTGKRSSGIQRGLIVDWRNGGE